MSIEALYDWEEAHAFGGCCLKEPVKPKDGQDQVARKEDPYKQDVKLLVCQEIVDLLQLNHSNQDEVDHHENRPELISKRAILSKE